MSLIANLDPQLAKDMKKRHKELYYGKGHNASGYTRFRLEMFYYDILSSIAMSRFTWINVPEEIDINYLERVLFYHDKFVFFKDEEFKVTKYVERSVRDIYNNPVGVVAYANNRYTKELIKGSYATCWQTQNKYSNLTEICSVYSQKLAKMDLIHDVDTTKLMRPLVMTAPQGYETTLQNMYASAVTGETVIFGIENMEQVKVEQFNSDYKIQSLDILTVKQTIFNEFLTLMGIDNNGFEKKERQVSDEVTIKSSLIANRRHDFKASRDSFCDTVNELFDLDIECQWNENIELNNMFSDPYEEPEPEPVEPKGGENGGEPKPKQPSRDNRK